MFKLLSLSSATLLTLAMIVGCADANPQASSPGTVETASQTKTTPLGSMPSADVEPTSAAEGLTVGKRAPNWTLRGPDGTSHSLTDYLGNVVVLDFWATWCGPCKMAMPDVQKLHEQLADRGVVVFGVDVFERGRNGTAKAMSYIRKMEYTYPQLVNGTPVARKYRANSIPTFVVIGVDGEIIYRAKGYVPNREKQIAAIIDKHLQQYGM